MRALWTKHYHEIINDNLLETFEDLEINKKNVYFQQNNDPKYMTVMTKKFLWKKKIDTLDWPTSSSGMSPIKHVWDYLDRRVYTWEMQPCNLTQLWTALDEESVKIPQNYIDKLFDGMPRWVEALLKKGGAYQILMGNIKLL